MPLESAVAVPSEVVPLWKSSTVLLASAVPSKVGVLSLLRLSELELPLSLLVAKSGVLGALGAVVSTVTVKLEVAGLVAPVMSVAVAVKLCEPSGRAVPV